MVIIILYIWWFLLKIWFFGVVNFILIKIDSKVLKILVILLNNKYKVLIFLWLVDIIYL